MNNYSSPAAQVNQGFRESSWISWWRFSTDQPIDHRATRFVRST